MLALRTLAICALLLTGSSGQSSRSGGTLDLSQYELSFSEDFKEPPRFYDAKLAADGRWKTNYAFGVQESAAVKGWESRTLQGNKELQYYGDPWDGTGSVIWKPGALIIEARKNPFSADAKTGNRPYLSGLITTEKSFQQQYGYFEARIALPIGKGLWSAFWLLPTFQHFADPMTPQPGQEIDVFENIGSDFEVHATLHHDDPKNSGKKISDGEALAMPSLVAPHDYGVMVTRDEIVWYYDHKEVRRRPNTDFHQPAYMLLNLAVGGSWPGAPDASTQFPAQMTIYSVKAYRKKPVPTGSK